MKKKILATVLASMMVLSMVGCGTDAAAKKEAESSTAQTAETTTKDSNQTYNVGVIQLVQHPALDTTLQA